MSRSAWNELTARVRPNDTIAVAWRDWFRWNFDEGVRIHAELTRQNIGIVAIREDTNTADESAAPKSCRGIMTANGACQVESASERIKAGAERAKAEGRKAGHPPGLTSERVHERWRMYPETLSIRRASRVLGVSQGAMKRAIGSMDRREDAVVKYDANLGGRQ